MVANASRPPLRRASALVHRPQAGPGEIDSRDRRPEVPGHPPDAYDDLGGFAGDIVDEWGRQSFPASDPPANW